VLRSSETGFQHKDVQPARYLLGDRIALAVVFDICFHRLPYQHVDDLLAPGWFVADGPAGRTCTTPG